MVKKNKLDYFVVQYYSFIYKEEWYDMEFLICAWVCKIEGEFKRRENKREK